MILKRHQTGLSMIELLVALAIGSVLILGLVQVFSASRAAYQLSEGLARTQENARFAIDFLQRDIRMAGHFGCINDQAHFVEGDGDPRLNFGTTINSGSGDSRDFSVSIQGYEAPSTAPGNSLTIGGTWAAHTGLPAGIAALSPRAGSDILVLRYLHTEGVPVTTIAAAGSGEGLTVDSGRFDALTADGVAAPVMFGIADCNRVDVFNGTATSPMVTTAANYSLGDRYTSAPSGLTMLYRAESVVYYVNQPAGREPGLWRARSDASGAYPVANREELVEGIESLQLLFGQDQVASITSVTPPQGNITVHNTATNVTTGATTDLERAAQWRRVGLVQVGILARSPNPAAAGQAVGTDQRQRVLGVEFAPAVTNDGRYRAGYEVTVALRNRLFGN